MLRDFIDRPKIKKYVDQRLPTLSKITKDPELQTQDPKSRGLDYLIDDTIALARNVQADLTTLINTIHQDKPVTPYDDYLRSTWSPLELKENPKSRPINKTIAEVTLLEREAYAHPDSQYKYLGELYRSRQLAEGLEYGFDIMWSQVDWPNDNPMVRYMVFQTQRTLKDILGFSRAVRGIPQGLDTGIQGLIQIYLQDILTGNNDSFKDDLKSTLGTLNTFSTVFKQSDLASKEHWEKIQKDLSSVGGDPFWFTIKNALISTWTAQGVKNFHYLQDLAENIIGTDIGDPISQSVLNQTIEDGIIEVFGQIEAHVNERHVQNAQWTELRTLAVHNGIKNLANKASLSAIDTVVAQLTPLVDQPHESAKKAFNNIRARYE